METKSHSYHTFIYPFSFKEKDKKTNKKTNRKTNNEIKVKEYLTKNWERESFNKEQQEIEKQYNTYQYFLPNARKNIFNLSDKNENSEHFKYALHPQKKSTYTITKRPENDSNNDEDHSKIAVDVLAIKLSLFYEMEIGLLSIETSYDPKEGEDFFQNVLTINDFGRRLFSPVYDVKGNSFLPKENTLCIQSAYGKEVKISTNFMDKESLADISKGKNSSPKLIKELLFENNEAVEVFSILDDRMFVSFLIQDNKLSKFVESPFTELEEKEKLYKIAFCDNSCASCQDDNMLEKKINEHTYNRWKRWGTIYTVTEYSLGCIKCREKDDSDYVGNSFLNLYTKMAQIALAQRAAIVNLETEAIRVGNLIDENSKQTEEIKKLWMKFLVFQNNLYMPEITFQEQGSELYEMMKKCLKLKDLQEYLEKELQNLFDFEELEDNEKERKNESNMNRMLALLGAAGAVFGVVSMAQDYLNNKGAYNTKDTLEILLTEYFGGFGFLVILSILIYVLIVWSKRGKIWLILKALGFIIALFFVSFIVYFMAWWC